MSHLLQEVLGDLLLFLPLPQAPYPPPQDPEITPITHPSPQLGTVPCSPAPCMHQVPILCSKNVCECMNLSICGMLDHRAAVARAGPGARLPEASQGDPWVKQMWKQDWRCSKPSENQGPQEGGVTGTGVLRSPIPVCSPENSGGEVFLRPLRAQSI